MRRAAAFALLLASCHQAAPTKRPVPPPKPRVGDVPRAGGGDDSVHTVHEVHGAIEAPHAGSISMLVATPDASAALTIDDLGGARLWPAIDGTREPCVVDLPAPKHLLLARRTTGFTATVLDESGGLYIAQLDDHGRTLAHTTHGMDPAYVGMATSTKGTIAWRADQHVLRIDDDGKIVDDLGTEAQQQVVDIAVAGNAAVALVDNAGARQLRWLALEPRLKWGAEIPGLLDTQTPVAVALSPNHKHIALTTEGDKAKNQSRQLFVVDDKGKAVVVQELEGATTDAEFADDSVVALGGGQGVSWLWVMSTGKAVPSAGSFAPPSRKRDMLAAGGGHALWPISGELMIMTPTETKFLGYETATPRVAQPAPDGGMLAMMGTSLYLLDSDLRMKSTPTLGDDTPPQATDILWVGGNDWLYQRPSHTMGGHSALYLAGVTDAKSQLVRDRLPEAHVLAYEPATELVTLSFGSTPEVAKLDRKARTVTELAAGPGSTGYEQTVFVPLDPKLAHGMQLLQISMRDKVTISWLADPRALDKPATTMTLDGAYAASDAGGHVYVWRSNADVSKLMIFADGKAIGSLPVAGAGTLWPDHGGTRILQLGTPAVTMFDSSGKALWTRDLAGAQEAHWLSDGTLAIVHSTGIVKLDPATGASRAARCGWGFGLASKPHAVGVQTEPICTMLDQ